MSARNGDKSRYQINRKRGVVRRAKIRAMVAGTVVEQRPADAKPRAASRQRAPTGPSRAEAETASPQRSTTRRSRAEAETEKS